MQPSMEAWLRADISLTSFTTSQQHHSSSHDHFAELSKLGNWSSRRPPPHDTCGRKPAGPALQRFTLAPVLRGSPRKCKDS